MKMILVINIGSTSLKYALIDMDRESKLATGLIERIGYKNSPFTHWQMDINSTKTIIDTTSGYESAIRKMLKVLIKNDKNKEGIVNDELEIEAVGFKTVHAGQIKKPTLLNDEVIKMMEKYSCVVPAHNPPYINAIKKFKKILPQTPLVGVFETYFHRHMPEYAYLYGVPYEWYEKHDIRKYGFHGASHRYAFERASEILNLKLSKGKLITCHLGGSSSIAAIQDGISIDTSMGFSTQSGIPMGNRVGELDPFIIPYIMENESLSFQEVMNILIKRGGLLGISDISGDERDLEEMSDNNNHRANVTIKLLVYNIIKYIGSYITIMNGVDVITFSGGIGENSPKIREKVCDGLKLFKISLNDRKNNKCIRIKEDTIISNSRSKVKVIVIPANEALIVARETRKVINELR
jgi:acetate kinase